MISRRFASSSPTASTACSLVPATSNGLAAALARLLDSPKLRDELATNGRSTIVELFDSEVNVRRFAAALWPERFAAAADGSGINMMTQRESWIAVAWAPYSRRSEMFARELGGQLHCIHYLKFRSPPYAPFKYVLQTVQTLRVLFTARPQAVHVQNPPFICGVVVAIYCRLTGARFVVEYHTAAFGRAWKWALPAHRFVAAPSCDQHRHRRTLGAAGPVVGRPRTRHVRRVPRPARRRTVRRQQ